MALEELGLVDEQLLVNNPALLLSADRDCNDAVSEPAIYTINRLAFTMLCCFTLPIQGPCLKRLEKGTCSDRFACEFEIAVKVCYIPVKTLEV